MLAYVTASSSQRATIVDTMPAFARIDLTVTELADELRFRVDREEGWVGRIALPLVFCAVLIFTLTLRNSTLRIGGASGMALGILYLAINRTRPSSTELSVTSRGFHATGYLGSGVVPFYRASVKVPADRVRSLVYAPGDDSSPAGLHLDCGAWNKECVLPGLTRQQTEAVAETILRRFPQFGQVPVRSGIE